MYCTCSPENFMHCGTARCAMCYLYLNRTLAILASVTANAKVVYEKAVSAKRAATTQPIGPNTPQNEITALNSMFKALEAAETAAAAAYNAAVTAETAAVVAAELAISNKEAESNEAKSNEAESNEAESNEAESKQPEAPASPAPPTRYRYVRWNCTACPRWNREQFQVCTCGAPKTL